MMDLTLGVSQFLNRICNFLNAHFEVIENERRYQRCLLPHRDSSKTSETINNKNRRVMNIMSKNKINCARIFCKNPDFFCIKMRSCNCYLLFCATQEVIRRMKVFRIKHFERKNIKKTLVISFGLEKCFLHSFSFNYFLRTYTYTYLIKVVSTLKIPGTIWVNANRYWSDDK